MEMIDATVICSLCPFVTQTFFLPVCRKVGRYFFSVKFYVLVDGRCSCGCSFCVSFSQGCSL